MALTIESLRRIDIPINVSNKPNNLTAFQQKMAPYNDSINLYEALQLVVGGGSGSATDINIVQTPTGVTVESSTGTDDTISSATSVNAGILLPADWLKIQTALQSISVGSGLTGTGTIGDPVDWPGVFVTGPLTGSGTSFFPLNILANSITTSHIQTGTILFADWNQNGATTGQIPQWNGTAWIASSTALPAGTVGDRLLHDGTSWQSVSEVVETKTGINNINITLAAAPLSYGKVYVYKNGMLQSSSDDYTRVGQLITFTVALVAADRVIIIYNV